jgi:threonine/homoserine/homoserine lactone efflux protein
MHYVSLFLLSFTIALSGALAPGPLLTAVIAESARSGAKTGPLVTLGHALAELFMVACIALGLARILNQPLVLKIISFSGAAMLAYFGVRLLFSLKTVSLAALGTSAGADNLAWMGITLSLLNPYWTVWWLSIGAGLVLGAQKAGWTGIAVFFCGHILADLAWYSFVSFSISKSRRLISLSVYKMILGVCASLLLVFGAGFAFYAFRA